MQCPNALICNTFFRACETTGKFAIPPEELIQRAMLYLAKNQYLDCWSKKLLGAPGIATRSKDATRGSWPYY